MPKYRKKPVVIEAVQFDGTLDSLLNFMPSQGWDYRERGAIDSPIALIDTLEGTMQANVGDYIIKGVNGEFYPCKPDIFAKTYDEVKPVDTQGGDAYREIMYNGWAAKQKAKEGTT